MIGAHAGHLLRKDLGVGPRSPIFLYAIVLPVILTLLVRVVFGSLFDPAPRLGIVDEGDSKIVQNVRNEDGIQVQFPASAADLKEMVENNDLDAGLVLPTGFDGALQAGQMPNVQFFFGGQSLASNRVVLGVTMVDLIREVAGSPAPIDVETITVGDGDSVPLVSRLLPLIVLMAVLIAGALTPATSLVEEKEKKTLTALLVTPTSLGDVLLAKGALGFILAMATGTVTLALNGALGANPAALLLVLVLATLMAAEVGLMLGSFAKDTKALYTIWKSGAIVLLAPVIFFIWPNLPQWIAKVFPTYYFLSPLFDIAIRSAGLADVWVELAIGFAICAVFLLGVAALGRRMEANLAAA
jgi:ABC-2 type transport system permease protein